MPTTIITKNGSGEPSADKLTAGELAVDLSNKRLYTKDNSGNILELGTNPGPDFPFPDQNGLTISDVAPLDPNEGDQWLNSDTAEVFIYDGAVWLEFPQGTDGAPGLDGAPGADGNIADATEQGVIATWDDTNKQWKPDSNLTIDATGDATFAGTIKSDFVRSYTKLDLRHESARTVFVQDENKFSIQANAETSKSFSLNNATGNAVFSGSVSVSADDAGIRVESLNNNIPHIDLIRPASSNNYRIVNDNGTFRILRGATDVYESEIAKYISGSAERWELLTGNQPRLTINSSGDATFSGAVSASVTKAIPDAGYWKNSGEGTGVRLTSTEIYPVNDANSALLPNTISIGSPASNFKDAFFSGTVNSRNTRAQRFIQDGSPVIDARGLIETLSTLRTATQDETIDVRQALASACDKLIEKFEAMQSTATQEIES